MRNAHRYDITAHPLLTVRELAAWLQIHPAALCRAARAGEIPAIKAGGRWHFSRDAVGCWILDRMNAQTALIEELGPWLLDFSRPRRARLWKRASVAAWVPALAWPGACNRAFLEPRGGLIVAPAQRVTRCASRRVARARSRWAPTRRAWQA
jgi:excisionase family DNA binding protein